MNLCFSRRKLVHSDYLQASLFQVWGPMTGGQGSACSKGKRVSHLWDG